MFLAYQPLHLLTKTLTLSWLGILECVPHMISSSACTFVLHVLLFLPVSSSHVVLFPKMGLLPTYCEKSYPAQWIYSIVSTPFIFGIISPLGVLTKTPIVWSKDKSKQMVANVPIYLTQSIKQERRRMWHVPCCDVHPHLLQSLGLISKSSTQLKSFKD
jgi:hypothetical protein